jgi:hypothetical protein
LTDYRKKKFRNFFFQALEDYLYVNGIEFDFSTFENPEEYYNNPIKIPLPLYYRSESDKQNDTIELFFKDFRLLKITGVSCRKIPEDIFMYHLMDKQRPFSKIVVGSDVQEYSFDPEIDLQQLGYKDSYNTWRIETFGHDKYVVHQHLTNEEIESMGEYRINHKFPQFPWGCWDPSSPFCGSVLIRCFRPNFKDLGPNDEMLQPHLNEKKFCTSFKLITSRLDFILKFFGSKKKHTKKNKSYRYWKIF